MTKPLRVLLLEDSDADAEMVTHELQRAGLSFMLGRVDAPEAYTAALEGFTPDVVLSDHSLARFDSRVALQIQRAVRPTAPFIIVTGALSGAESVDAIRAGAEDVILKRNLGRLPASIANALAVRRPLHRLTNRQVEVLRLMAEGCRSRDIARRLSLSVKTVECHRGDIMKRLCLHNIVSVVRYAIRVGLVPTTHGACSDAGSSTPGLSPIICPLLKLQDKG